MRYSGFLLFLVVCCMSGLHTVQAQTATAPDNTYLPGSDFSLQGALDLFKKANSPEEFEKMLNTEGNGVNNLDLNNDGQIDYIRVVDIGQGNDQVFVLQVPVSETENQDVATIEIEKDGDNSATVQIVGDEDLYGDQKIVEPVYDDAVYQDNPSPSGVYTTNDRVVNVWEWPMVRYIYAPTYVVWVSPWSWRARPVWWHPWRPVERRVFYKSAHAYRGYVVVHNNRMVNARKIYTPVRVTSVTVARRNQAAITHYRTTRTVERQNINRGPGNKQIRSSRTTTVRKGNPGGGSGKATRTTTTVRKRR